MRLSLFSACVIFLCLGACAEGEVDPDRPIRDTGLSDAQQTFDATDSAAASDADGASDVSPDDPCGACCPGDLTCLDDGTVGVCLSDGSGYEPSACGEGDRCVGGACEPEPICSPGEAECFDDTTRLICRPNGLQYRQEACNSGQSCIGGDCVVGEPNGAACVTAADCAGGKCRCGASEGCVPAPASPFCTEECTPGGCGQGQFCVEADFVDGASYNYCVPTCDEACSQLGLNCVSLPTLDSGQLAWVKGCHANSLVAVGSEGCVSDQACAGDTCLSGYFDRPLCTHRCDGACPAGTACVELQDGEAYCSPRCGSGAASGSEPCPLDPDRTRSDVVCAVLPVVAGSISRVCEKPI